MIACLFVSNDYYKHASSCCISNCQKLRRCRYSDSRRHSCLPRCASPPYECSRSNSQALQAFTRVASVGDQLRKSTFVCLCTDKYTHKNGLLAPLGLACQTAHQLICTDMRTSQIWAVFCTVLCCYWDTKAPAMKFKLMPPCLTDPILREWRQCFISY